LHTAIINYTCVDWHTDIVSYTCADWHTDIVSYTCADWHTENIIYTCADWHNDIINYIVLTGTPTLLATLVLTGTQTLLATLVLTRTPKLIATLLLTGTPSLLPSFVLTGRPTAGLRIIACCSTVCQQRTDTNHTVCFVTAGDSVFSPELNLAHRMKSALPPFVPSSSERVTNEQCIKDSQLYLQELRKLAVWALKSEYLLMRSMVTQ
jgi:hypothetical protein